MSWELTDFGRILLLDRYAKKDDDGNPVEITLEQVWGRAANWAASAEDGPVLQEIWAEKFYEALSSGQFVPGGRILAASGIDGLTPYNCFVIPSPRDSREGIMESLSRWMEIQSRGGGVGVALDSLRPSGARVGGVNGTSSGPVAFANLFSEVTNTIIQGGSRRGAAMIMLDVSHPDVMKFIDAKRDPNMIQNANISVKISDSFMQAVKNDEEWVMSFTDEHGRQYVEKEQASVIWSAIADAAWTSAEPGVVFMERVNRESPIGYCVEHVSTNPCGEIPLGPNEVCLLASINHHALVKTAEDGSAFYDFDRLEELAALAVRFLDNIIDVAFYPFAENEAAQKRIRRLGIGGMGLADAMLELGIRYGSPESVEFTESVYRTASISEWRASALLAKEKGAFPAFDLSYHLQTPLAMRMPDDVRELIKQHGIRNGVLETQAPTGTTAALMGVSSGIEPIFDYVLRRSDRTGERVLVHPVLRDYMPAGTNWEELADQPSKLEELFAQLPDHFVSTRDLTPEEHVDVQAAAQKWVGNAISKTTNAPKDYTKAQVQKLYQYAYDKGLKGITLYRDGSRDTQVLYHVGDSAKPAEDEYLPEVLSAIRIKVRFPAGNGYVTISERAVGDPIELFVLLGKSGTGDNASAEALGRMISSLWRHSNLSPQEKIQLVIDQLDGIKGDTPFGWGSRAMTTMSDGIVFALGRYLEYVEQNPARRVLTLEECVTGECK